MSIKILNKYKVLTRNVFHLGLLHVFSTVIPIFLIPFVVVKIGLTEYGVLAFALTITNYALIFVNFGFDFSGAKRISNNRNNLNKIATILTSITIIKLVVFCLIMSIFFIVVFFIAQTNFYVYLFSLLLILDSILLPKWFFLGLEKVKYISYAYGVSKIISSILIIVFLSLNYPTFFIPLSYFLGILFTGAYSYYVLFNKLKIPYQLVSRANIIEELKHSSKLFLSSISINIYRNSSMLLAGFILNPVALGSYALAERIIKAIQSFSSPLTQALFPHFSSMNSKLDLKTFKRQIFTIAKYLTPVLILLVVLVVTIIPYVSVLIDSADSLSLHRNIYFLSPIILFGTLNFIFGFVGLVNLGYERKFMRLTVIATLVNIIITPLLILYSPLNVPLPLLITEVLLFLLIYRNFKRV